jgi:hypothetical protein
VFRYRERGAGAVSVANRRFAGKLYARCPDHGRVGGDTHDAGMQDYILKHATLDSPAIGGAVAPVLAPAPEKKTPAIAGAQKPRGFGFFRS